jgi:peptidoglycan hydrolase-like amidase
MQPQNRKFPGKPYDGSDDPATFQSYLGVDFSGSNPRWTTAVTSTANQVLMFGGELIKPPYFSSDDGRTRSPSEAGWTTFPFISIFTSKPDPWCNGLQLRGHGVGMSGCGALGQAKEGKSAEQILNYYYPGTRLGQF